MTMTSEMRFEVENAIAVSAILERPANARWMLALAAQLRYQFPYMEQQRRLPDTPAVLTATVRAAVRAAAGAAPELPLLAGGKSLGGRMTSTAAPREPLEGVW